MPPFPKPRFIYNFNSREERDALRRHKAKRGIPEKELGKLLLGTWNIANLGNQDRWDDHYGLIGEILSWYDVVAVQEVNDDLTGLRHVLGALPDYYRAVFSDKAGNNERAAFLYDTRKVQLMEKIGEVAIPPSEHRHIKLPGVNAEFKGFDRNPYLASFEYNNFTFILLNVHVYFGSERQDDMERRALEAFAIARYADLRRNSKNSYTDHFMVMGDFNLPKVEPGDLIYDALTRRGLQLPKHSTKVYSNIVDDKQYDQIAFFPGMKSRIIAHGVFDFDNAVFPDLWQTSPADFRHYLRYYLSDHRPLWIQLDVS